MASTISHAKADDFHEEMERLIEVLETRAPPACGQGMKAFLTALDYKDPALVRAARNETTLAFAEAAADDIRRIHRLVDVAREMSEKALAGICNGPAEDFDSLGNELRTLFDTILGQYTQVRTEWVQFLLDWGCEIENVNLLDDDIVEMNRLKERVLENWPWSDEPLAPVDRDMVARSRASIGQGGGEPIEDVIRRLESNSTKG